jgi:hypothetical protein
VFGAKTEGVVLPPKEEVLPEKKEGVEDGVGLNVVVEVDGAEAPKKEGVEDDVIPNPVDALPMVFWPNGKDVDAGKFE